MLVWSELMPEPWVGEETADGSVVGEGDIVWQLLQGDMTGRSLPLKSG